ncbi:P2X purinoceptor 3-like isoform X2 [Brienomyrus brachyistius]|uniref:P2X purinoceptor 3-like isoform X2 n=1 Tax=Brienomyrus brachyistius TaxID=42636 RepID=UPI0020B195E4|nr:P2X purinoceptor 3-like isoform X2 [Brienomyrus brachyistius]
MMLGCASKFFTYETTKSVVVKSWTLGIINRTVQLLIIVYFVCWVFLHEKAYQLQDTAIESSVTTKVKGNGIYDDKVMDITDLISPPEGTSVFCITTRLITTKHQFRGSCPHRKYSCNKTEDCKKYMSQSDNGIITGRCVECNSSHFCCEVRGWCPTEVSAMDTSPITEVENFTIFIKNSIRFPTFDFSKGNFLTNITAKHIQTCKFDMQDNIYCPIFKVRDVLHYANQNFSAIAQDGGVIGIKIGWLCDLDWSEEHCNPTYTFNRLDALSQRNNISKGYNFRYAKYYTNENGTEYRTLFKVFAIRFDVLVYGQAGKFNLIPALINFVAAFTSVGLGTVLCDIILLHFLKGSDQYKAKKFEQVTAITNTSCIAKTNDGYQGSCQLLSVKHKERGDVIEFRSEQGSQLTKTLKK